MNRRKVTICLFLLAAGTMLHAQTVLTLDSCRQLALRNNKQLNVSRLKQEVAADSRRAARTKYLPKVDAFAGYELTSKEVSILSDKNKAALSQLGTSAATSLSESLTGLIGQMTKDGLISPQTAQALGGYMGVLAKGERCVSTTNRNFVGRMGDPESEVILSGVPVAASSAVLGRVGTPDEL